MDNMEKGMRRNNKEKPKESTLSELRRRLGLAAALAAALSGAAPSPAAGSEWDMTDAPAVYTTVRPEKPQAAPKDPNRQWFEQTLKQRTLDNDTLATMERLVMSEQVDLSSQLRFMQRAFDSERNGPYVAAFENPDLTMKTVSNILTVVNHVTTHLRQFYERHEVLHENIPGFEHLFKYMERLRDSVIAMSDTIGGSMFCNAFARWDGSEIRLDSDGHCVDTKHPAWHNAMMASESADVATTTITWEQYKQYKGKYPTKLPVLDTQKVNKRTIPGQPVVSYSIAPDGAIKVHFAIAMPWTAALRKLFPQIDVGEDTLFALKPPEEGIAIHDAQGKKIGDRGSGESGSLVAMPGEQNVYVVGGLVAVGDTGDSIKEENRADSCIINDANRKICYTTFFFNSSEIHEKLAQQHRALHGHMTLK